MWTWNGYTRQELVEGADKANKDGNWAAHDATWALINEYDLAEAAAAIEEDE